MAGGDAAAPAKAPNAVRGSVAQSASLAQQQASSAARLQRGADVSKLGAQRAKSDKGGGEGAHTQVGALGGACTTPAQRWGLTFLCARLPGTLSGGAKATQFSGALQVPPVGGKSRWPQHNNIRAQGR